MAKELPYLQFYPSDWLADCHILSLEARGAWITIICKVWNPQNPGILELTLNQFSKIFGTNLKKSRQVIEELRFNKIANVELFDDVIRITSRRIIKDFYKQVSNKQKYAEAGKKGMASRYASKPYNMELQRKPNVVSESLQHIETETETDKNPIVPKRDLRLSKVSEERRIYEVYPKKVGGAVALKAIAKALKVKSFEYLLEATTAWAEACKTMTPEEKQFVPHPATWFNQARYDDDRFFWNKKINPEIEKTEKKEVANFSNRRDLEFQKEIDNLHDFFGKIDHGNHNMPEIRAKVGFPEKDVKRHIEEHWHPQWVELFLLAHDLNWKDRKENLTNLQNKLKKRDEAKV